MRAIDLNSDLAESFGAWKMADDGAMLGIVTSANVACGFHAGDPAGILKTLRTARNAVLGATVRHSETDLCDDGAEGLHRAGHASRRSQVAAWSVPNLIKPNEKFNV